MNRDKRIVVNMILSCLIKGGGVCISLLLFPAYMTFFKSNQILGIWYTVLSVVSWILTFDFGIGNGLRNHYVKCIIEGNFIKKKKLISTTYILAVILAIALDLISLMIIYAVNWNTFFNISTQVIDLTSLRIIMMYTLGGILLQFVLKIVNSILQAEQMPALADFLGMISNILLLIAVQILPSNSDVENLKMFSKIYLLASNVPLIVTTLIIFNTKLSSCRPNIRYYDKAYRLGVMKLGIGFFWLQLVAMIIFNTNNFLITWCTGSQNVVYYQTYFKLFNLVGSFAWISLTPIWSAVTEAYEKKDYTWMKSTYKKLMIIVGLTIFANIILIMFLQPIVDLWLGEASFLVDRKYAILFGVYNILYVWWGIHTSFSNGTGKIKIQLIFATFGAFINIPLAYLIANLVQGWIGVVVANIISMLFYCIAESIHINKIMGSKIGRTHA